jgi:hypothetical protein
VSPKFLGDFTTLDLAAVFGENVNYRVLIEFRVIQEAKEDTSGD